MTAVFESDGTVSRVPPVRSEPLFCVLAAARELLVAYDEYAVNPGATCERCGKARDRLRAAVNYHDTQNAGSHRQEEG